MNNVDKVITVLVDILQQYLWDSQRKSEVYDEDDICWLEETQKEDDVCVCEEADELSFD